MSRDFIFSMLLGIFVGLLLGVLGFALFQNLYKSEISEGLEAELAEVAQEAEKIAFKEKTQEEPQENTNEGSPAVLYAEVEERQGKEYWQRIFLKKSPEEEVREIDLPDNAFHFEMPILSHNEIFFYAADGNTESPENDQLFLFRMGLDGREAEEVLPYTPGVSPSGFLPSPDRKKIAYFLDSRVNEGSEIWVYDTENGINFVAVELLDKQVNKNIVSWSADSSRLYFLKKMKPYLYILHWVDIKAAPKIQTQEFQNIYWESINWQNLLKGELSFFTLSPDKKYIAYLPPLKNQINFIRTSDGVITSFTPTSSIKEILWHPNSAELIYTQKENPGIFKMNLALRREEKFIDPGPLTGTRAQGSVSVPLTHTQVQDSAKDVEIKNIQITPDGSFLGYIKEKEDFSEIILNDLESGERYTIAREEEASEKLRLLSLSYLSRERPFQKEIVSELQVRRVEEGTLEEDEIRQVIGYITANINAIAPEKRESGWEVKRFWFIDSRNLYVDFESGSDLRRVFLSFDILTEEEAGYRIKAYFEAVGDKWVLRKGQVLQEEQSLILYTFNKNTNSWERNNN